MQALYFNSTELDKRTKGGGNESINAVRKQNERGNNSQLKEHFKTYGLPFTGDCRIPMQFKCLKRFPY